MGGGGLSLTGKKLIPKERMISSSPHLKRLHGPGHEVIREFTCSTQLDMKFQMLISMKISRKLAFSSSDKRKCYFSCS